MTEMAPHTEEELADIIRTAEGPLAIGGGGTRYRHDVGATLTTKRMSGIQTYEAGALTLVVKAGTRLTEIEDLLAQNGQMLAFEPPRWSDSSTIGGVIATNASGSRRFQVGAARDFLLGVRFVDGRGTILKNGGRVMKNVTGYDLVKLLAGSWGTLGVLSEVALKTLPLPEETATLCIPVEDASQAVQALSLAMKSPYDVTGAAYTPQETHAMLRIEGFPKSVSYRTKALGDWLKAFAAPTVLTGAEARGVWTKLRDCDALEGKEGVLWRVSCKPTDGPAVAKALRAKDWIMDWSGGLIHARLPTEVDPRNALASFQCHATCLSRTPTTFAKFHPEPDLVANYSKSIRDQFDPRGILNQGVMGA